MSSAQRDLLPLDEAPNETEAAQPFALREQVAQRLAAHRARRGTHANTPVTPIAKPANPRASQIAAAVAERYAHSQSYRAFLAAQAESAIREAEAAAEVAAISAQAIADAQYHLLDELDQWSLTPPPEPETPTAKPSLLSAAPTATQPAQPQAAPRTSATETPTPGLTIRLYEEPTRTAPQPPTTSNQLRTHQPPDETETLALDEEIAFRQAPVFEEVYPPTEIPANLIEFPRQLVAARKARPRLAEGPLREDADLAPETAQLRIFEVEATQISTAPAVESAEPEWSSILLAAHPVAAAVESPEAPFIPTPSPQIAPISLRLMATIVDACIVTAAFLLFTAAFAFTVGKLDSHAAASSIGATGSTIISHMSLQTAAIASVVTLAILGLLYQLLFFTFSDATPGMRYAHIGLCTFSDENPTRSAMRRRIFAAILAACPFGIGFLWAWMDEDGLGWHDRLSRMYQRPY